MSTEERVVRAPATLAGIRVLALLLAASAAGTAAYAGSINAYVVFGQERVEIGHNSVVTGLVGSASLLNERAPRGSEAIPGIGRNALANARPDMPSLPAATPFVSGGKSYKALPGSTLTLDPNRYGSIFLGGSNTLNFSSGSYYLGSLRSGTDVTWNLDLTGGPIRVFAKNCIDFGSVNMVLNGGSASDVKIESHCGGLNAFRAGGNSTVFGDIFSPYGGIQIGSGGTNSSFSGHLWGRQVLIDQGVVGSAPAAAVPEPASGLLLLAGLGLLAGRLRRVRRAPGPR